MKKRLTEEEYASNINVGTFRTNDEAVRFLNYLRQKYGFTDNNSYINNNNVIVTIEKSQMDDSYYHDMVNALRGESTNRYKRIAESKLAALIYNALNEAASNARQLTPNKDYTIVTIDSPEEALRYGKYTSWCVTHDPYTYDSYTADGTGRFYFCLRRGFENEPKVKGEGCPLDSYGLSMIAVSVTMEGEVNTIACRWNHDNGGNDSIMTIEQLEDLLGRNFYQTFKPYTREELHARGIILFDEVQGLLDSGKGIEKIFNWFDIREEFTRVELNKKWNFINAEGKIISNQWFDGAANFYNGFAQVELNRKYNLINTEGKLLSNQWFKWVSKFSYGGFAKVKLNDKWNLINAEGKFLLNQWLDNIGDSCYGFTQVELNNKYNFLNIKGKFVSNQWFDEVGYFHDGFAKVKLDGKLYQIDTEGNLYDLDAHKKVVAESKLTALIYNALNEALFDFSCWGTD